MGRRCLTLNGATGWSLPFIKIFGRRKFSHRSRRSPNNQITSSNRTERRQTRQRLCRTSWMSTWALGPDSLGPRSHQIWTLSTSACGWMNIEENARKTRLSNTVELKAAENRAWLSGGKALSGRSARLFDIAWSLLLPPQVTILNNLVSLGVNTSQCHKIIWFHSKFYVSVGVWSL